MALIKVSAAVNSLLVVVVFCCTLCAGESHRYFKAECLTSAGYLKVGGDGTYTVTWREHMGVFVQERGRWDQKGAVITFRPTKPTKAPYEGIEVTHEGKTFLAWASEGAAGIVIPIEETKKELDRRFKSAAEFSLLQDYRRDISTRNKADVSLQVSAKQALNPVFTIFRVLATAYLPWPA